MKRFHTTSLSSACTARTRACPPSQRGSSATVNSSDKYGLGRVPPGRRRRRRFITSGYLVEAASLEALAGKIGVDAAGLRETVRQHNRFAETGEDQEFGKGSTGPRLVLSVGSPLREVSVIFSEGAKRESKRARP